MRTNQHVYGERAFWVKGLEAELVLARTLTVILREKDRSDQVLTPKQWLPIFAPIPVYRLVDGTGDQAKGVLPEFHKDSGTTVQIVRRAVGRLGDVKYSDLFYNNGSAVPRQATDVAKYFGTEMSPGKEFPPETVITIYWVEYLPDETPASD